MRASINILEDALKEVSIAVFDDGEYHLESIVNKRLNDGVVRYLVQWTPSWVPAHYMTKAANVVDEYERQVVSNSRL